VGENGISAHGVYAALVIGLFLRCTFSATTRFDVIAF
jgi:hypothetical protein